MAARFHDEFLECWEHLGISWDLYTTTGTENHARVVQDIFLKLLENGDIYQDTMDLPYCTVEQRFLLDRYVEGTCPICGDTNARGDQCDNCGNILDPIDLIDRRCKFDGSTPEIRESEHFFLRLSAYNDRLREWLSDRQGALADERPQLLARHSSSRASRTAPSPATSTGASPIPVAGCEDKRIYVWFETVIGYLSAAIEWAERSGEPERWRDFWQDPECKSYYFIGKDNILFHTLIWPAQLMGYREANGEHYNLPYDVPANQYQTIRGSKVSTSRRLAVCVPDFLTPVRPRPAALLPRGDDAGDLRLRLHVGGLRPAQQRRAGRHLGQPREPRAHLHLPELRPRRP